ncbi:MAG: hypothetical protein BEU05_01430 [Marine Group III euryarchaeote CG-Bathy2]|uniref:WD40-like beta propeller repeat-containing protein (TolB) n=3 Tax=Methanobacteriati TaxID=3366610 RepID=A0A075HKT2_9EURY|nr:WD40-like beta propeller repeat-containing protein (tolB) [uncultured marine group II/III euryarchaeote KM3_59_B11]AIF17006.1 WD40-like beta propeller repeat-containing protein (tolB) [uncultured marine group II/III euryarchaeote KM3_75_F08]OIR10579.1 MAG: hypothetical protein BEU05_01430 [Marine Group III euryarchaeote CG-Bathy2]
MRRSRSSLALLVATLLLFPATGSVEYGQPLVAITSLADGDWVEGVVEVTVAAEGEVAYVELFANGELLTTATCLDCIAWDTTVANATAPAEFTLVARAVYDDGSQAESTSVRVTVLYPRQLTFDGAADLQPEWSPSGDRLVFKSNRGLEEHIYHLYTISPTGGEPQPIESDRSYHGYPGWSPDGERMVFNSYAPEEGETTSEMDIYVVNLSSSESVQVTSDPAFDDSGRWSPAGDEITFHSSRGGSLDVWKVAVAPDGTPQGDPQRLTTGDASEHCPRWSFDGEWIVYEADDGETNDIWVMRADGSEKRQVTDDPHYDRYPGWSPDGEWLIYDSDRDGNRDLYLVPVAGGTPRRITMDPALDRHADWSPQGNVLAFHSTRGGSLDIWLVEIPDPTGVAAADDTEASLAATLALGAAAAAVIVLLRRRRPRQE